MPLDCSTIFIPGEKPQEKSDGQERPRRLDHEEDGLECGAKDGHAQPCAVPQDFAKLPLAQQETRPTEISEGIRVTRNETVEVRPGEMPLDA